VVKDGLMIALPVVPLVGSLLDVTRTVVERTVATATFAVSVPARAEALLDNVESLIRRVDAVVTEAADAVAQANAIIGSTGSLVAQADAVAGQAQVIVGQVGTVAEQAQLIVGEVGTVAAQAQTIIESAGRSADLAGELLDTYEPLARKAAPLASQFVEELSPEEVHAAIVMLDRLPELADRMNMIMPILGTLDTVSPEIHELLCVVKDLRQAITGVPGFNFLRRRGEDKENAEE